MKGSASCPAYATMDWTTPALPGHYCVQVSFAWPDDLNPFNNLGQENTQVVMATSPACSASLCVTPKQIAKTIGSLLTYSPSGHRRSAPTPASPSRRRARRRLVRYPVTQLARQKSAAGGLDVAFAPPAPTLVPGEQIDVTVTVTPPDSFTGDQPLNVHIFCGSTLIGGITSTLRRA